MVLFTWLSALQEDTPEVLGLEKDEASGAVVVDVSQPVLAEIDKRLQQW